MTARLATRSTRTAPEPPAPSAKPAATQEQVSISLIDLLEELKNHVGTDKQQRLQQLKQQAADHPEEQVKLKRDILMLAGAEALRAAVTALMNKPKPPPPEPPLPSLWGENMSKEDFKASLVHSFHCRTPSCPVPDCASITSKLQRLHQHVSTCEAENCLLCRMWTNLKYYRDAGEGMGSAAWAPAASSAALFTEPLINSSQLLPRWSQGTIAWMKPQEALAQVGAMTAHPGLLGAVDGAQSSGAGLPDTAAACQLFPPPDDGVQVAPRVNGAPPAKRRRNNSSKNATSSGSGGSAPGPSVPNPHEQFAGMASALHTPATIAYLSSLDATDAGGVNPQRQMQDMLRMQGPLNMQDLELEAQMGGALRGYQMGGMDPAAAAAMAPNGMDGMGGVLGGAAGGAARGGAAGAGLPMCRCGSSNLSFGLSALTGGGGLGSSANLAELLKTPSLSQLSSFTGGSAAGLSLKGTRTDNASNVSLGTFLENNGGDINDILNDFGVGS